MPATGWFNSPGEREPPKEEIEVVVDRPKVKSTLPEHLNDPPKLPIHQAIQRKLTLLIEPLVLWYEKQYKLRKTLKWMRKILEFFYFLKNTYDFFQWFFSWLRTVF